MKSLMTATALAALVAASSAFAQSTDYPAPASPPAATEPAPAAPSMTPAEPAPSAPSATPDATMPDASAPDTAAATPSGADMFLTEQAPDDHLASALIGASVKNGADEDLGAINDIVLSDAGEVDAIVIGVGGFLGIGEKNVAVSFDAIDKSTDADGNVVLKLETTKEQLEAAPAFVTVAEARQELESSTPAAPDAPAAPPPAQ
jgi:glucose/arabinose dehydrogenase